MEKECLEKLNETRLENKENLKRASDKLKKMIDDADYCILLATEKGCAVVGCNIDVMTALGALLIGILNETKITKEDLKSIFDLVSENVEG